MADILADDTLNCIFMNEKYCILILISPKIVPAGQIDNNSSLIQVMYWRIAWTNVDPVHWHENVSPHFMD